MTNQFQQKGSPILTKLTPPQYTQKAMNRPRLLERFGQLRSYQVIGIVAPPGFGKSVTLSQWEKLCQRNRIRTAWLNLVQEDNDAFQLLQYLLTAIAGGFKLTDNTSLKILKSGGVKDLKNILINFIQEIQFIKHTLILFIDDFHFLEDLEALQLWQWLVDHLPQNLKLYLASRTPFSLKLGRLKLNQLYYEIDSTTLLFNEEEIYQFFNIFHQNNLQAPVLKTLAEKTEG